MPDRRMKPRIWAAVLLAIACARPQEGRAPSSPALPAVISADVDSFWRAYDSVRGLSDSAAQVEALRRLYIDRGTPGLAAFITARGYTAEEWVGAIRRYPKFWTSIRPRTLELQRTIVTGLPPWLDRLRQLYPTLRPATVYVSVGALRSAGTTQDSLVLIGAELAAGGTDVDISEFSGGTRAFLTRYFASEPRTTIVPLTVHEVVHTQQRGIGYTVLARALREGGADLITELVTGARPPLPYMTAGPAREPALRERFRGEMFTRVIRNWFYNQTSTDPAHVPDLGYYMGYAITKAYYERAADKSAAIREIIELSFDDDAAVESFLERSGYYPGPVDRAALLSGYEARRPVVTRVVAADRPAVADGIDARTTELRVEFSEPMDPSFTGVGLSAGGRAELPITGRVGFSSDGRAYTFRVALEPGRRYRFVMEGSEGGGFRSAATGFPLRTDTVTFVAR